MPQVRTFQAREMKEALALVRRDLGPEAMILGTRRVPGRAMGLLGGSLIEIQARAADVDPSAPPGAPAPSPTPSSSAAPPGEEGPPAVANRHRALLALSRAQRRQHDRPSPKTLREQIDDQPNSALAAATGSASRDTPAHNALRRRLLSGLVPRELCESWLRQVPDHLDESSAHRHLAEILTRALGEEAALTAPGSRIAAFVGPTGVGKTTTISKLAAIAKLIENRSVALVTLDDARIGASAQLRAYAELLEVPFHVCGHNLNLARTLATVLDADLVLIDTAGCPINDLSELAALNQRLQRAGEPVSVHLCVAAATRFAELERILHVYRPYSLHAVLPTKLDEAVAVGSMFAAQAETRLPFSFVTTGQQIPDDLARATPQLLVSTLLGESTHDR
ncbi:MAG: flagellar biosynthesis protein FlhF [Myxococcales bacterium FL481]|nr:MAG: flagellar biosynthesis protein FlhF [Myxococcales bacterium FL481]